MPRSRTASRLVALMTLLVVTTAWTAGAASAASSDSDSDGLSSPTTDLPGTSAA